MTVRAASWSTQQLAEFVAAVSSVADADLAARAGVERVAEALDADAVALMYGERLAYAIGWPAGATPVDAIRAAVAADLDDEHVVPVPGLGYVPITRAEVGEDGDAYLVVAREGEPPDAEEKGLLRAMARTLGLAMHNHQVVSALRERQRLLEGLSEIQRAIALREPLHQVLNTIVGLAQEILGDDQAALMLRDPADPDSLIVAASTGVPQELEDRVQRRRIDEGIGGRAVLEDRLIVAERYAESSAAMSLFVKAGLASAMAAPVHIEGDVVGCLLVSSYRHGLQYTPADQNLLITIAQQASLALTDARIVSDMVHQALHDPLTGMPNRALFGDRLAHALQRTERTTSEVAVLFVDLDRFKPVNDSLGHAVGDEVLCVVAERISGCLRESDTAARLGGDEFAVLLEEIDTQAEATTLAQRIIDTVAAPIVIDGRHVFVGASIGIATGQRGAEDLLRKADLAMYRAKADGRGRSVLFEPRMQGQALERLELEIELRGAIERAEMELFYQPIVVLDSGALHGVEALLRWHHPERGLVGPADFIPLAEETGLIIEIGWWVLETACRQLAAWHGAGAQRDLTMNVNLSGRQLEDPGLHSTVADALSHAAVDEGSLILEITETVLMHDTDATIERLRALRALGVRLAVDDFGTGYSSLRYLNRFPIDVLKMASPFVEPLDAGSERRSLAQTIVSLGSNLGLPVIAEGIERPEQHAALVALGCELGQGYHFGRPVPAAEIEPQILGKRPANGGGSHTRS